MDKVDYRAIVAEEGGIRPAARRLNMPESTLRGRLKKELAELLTTNDQYEIAFTSYRLPRAQVYEPLADRPRYFILTAAQDSSSVHEDFWRCLQVYAEYLEECEIIVSGFTYNKKLFEEHDKRSDRVGYHPLIDSYIVHDRINIGDKLVFCGEMNTLPTAVTPLSGFQTYTRDKWGIFPHVKVQLESVPTRKGDIAKQIMTTGAVTLPNYVRKKAGIKGMFHHVIGAVLVEVAPDGSFWCRHLLATDMDDGSFYDLDLYITRDGVTDGHRVEAITYGDIHHEKLDPVVAMATWGYSTIARAKLSSDFLQEVGSVPLVEYLRPHYEFYHDLSDFSPRNHHNIKDHHFRLATHHRKIDNVEFELAGCATFLTEVAREDCMAIVVQSNHDNALIKWLKTVGESVKFDPENYEFFLRTELKYVQGILSGHENPPIFEETLRELGCPQDVVFVGEDDSFLICGDIECAMHGHLGANGAKPSPKAFTRMGSKSNTGHTHSPAILDGAYVAGVSGKLDMGYNKGLSSWAHAHIVTYPNGKRTILTMMNGRFFA